MLIFQGNKAHDFRGHVSLAKGLFVYGKNTGNLKAMQFAGNKRTGKVWLLTWYLVIITSFCLAQAHMIYDLDILRFTEILLSHAKC